VVEHDLVGGVGMAGLDRIRRDGVDACVGFGRIVISEIEATTLLPSSPPGPLARGRTLYDDDDLGLRLPQPALDLLALVSLRLSVKVTGLAQKLDAINRDLQSKSWANLKNWANPVIFMPMADRGGSAAAAPSTGRGGAAHQARGNLGLGLGLRMRQFLEAPQMGPRSTLIRQLSLGWRVLARGGAVAPRPLPPRAGHG
jgi:hypothetical protein